MEARLNELESRVAFQDDLVEELNRIVAAQQQQIDLLQQQLQLLYDHIRTLSPTGMEPSTEEERPPHY